MTVRANKAFYLSSYAQIMHSTTRGPLVLKSVTWLTLFLTVLIVSCYPEKLQREVTP